MKEKNTLPSMFRNAPPKHFSFAQTLRLNETPAEKILWDKLKNKQFHGLKWRRQHPFGKYILDFFCRAKSISIELDGAYHFTPEQQQYDAIRTEFIKNAGVLELRFTNSEIENNLEDVLRQIKHACDNYIPPALPLLE